VLYNLLNNAAIHTQAGSRIDIAASCHADRLTFTIEDSGNGLGRGNAKDVFYKFSRERTAKPGASGLGLSIVKGFTEALHGTVELKESELGGARFTLVFPVKTSYFKVESE
jgi:two-component system sensor histidine kinase KdpD